MPSSDEQAIFDETEACAKAWNQGDAKAAAAFYTEDGARVGAFGDAQLGRAEIEAAYDRLLHQTMPGAIVKQERGEVRMLSAELAVWQAGIQIIPPGGGLTLKGYVVQVMKKAESRWLILEHRCLGARSWGRNEHSGPFASKRTARLSFAADAQLRR